MAGQGQGQQGGGHNNSNKRDKRARAAAAPVFRPQVFNQSVKPPGGAHIVGNVPPPVEPTNRPRRG